LKSIGFRVDASIQIGMGHVMRCLSLADTLRKHGVNCIFFCRPRPGDMLEVIKQRGYKAVALPSLGDDSRLFDFKESTCASWLGTRWDIDAFDTYKALNDQILDWLIVDHYALDQNWESALRIGCRHLMVIDDLADRPHDCDILLDQNLGRSASDYKNLLSENVLQLVGPKFALLREEFEIARPESLVQRSTIKCKHLLIAMGGIDQHNITEQILEALETSSLQRDLRISVVLGSKAPHLENVKIRASIMNWKTRVISGLSDVAKLMSDSDLAIGAAGVTAWERCCMGLPSIIMVLADNQRAGAIALENAGAALIADNVNEIVLQLKSFLSPEGNLNLLERMSASAANIVDGRGTARVCRRIIDYEY